MFAIIGKTTSGKKIAAANGAAWRTGGRSQFSTGCTAVSFIATSVKWQQLSTRPSWAAIRAWMTSLPGAATRLARVTCPTCPMRQTCPDQAQRCLWGVRTVSVTLSRCLPRPLAPPAAGMETIEVSKSWRRALPIFNSWLRHLEDI